MATTRLRKTFQYPADNSDEDEAPRDMDEEGKWKQDGKQASIDERLEQEKLIKKLREEDEERNKEYKVA